MQQVIYLQILLFAQHVSGHHYAHHQELENINSWLLPVVCGAMFLRCRYGVELRVVCPVCGLLSKDNRQQPTVYYPRAPDDGHNGARNMLS
jgi:hypothetical protein